MTFDPTRMLIGDLLADPQRFDEQGKAYQLLQSYFEGYPIDTLRPLLRSGERLVQKAAAFVVSELGTQASALLDDIALLMDCDDRYLKYHAMEALTVCADGEQAPRFARVVRELESDDPVLRVLAMRLIANADASQLSAARCVFSAAAEQASHARALAALSDERGLNVDQVCEMIAELDPLIRRYGAIGAKRLRRTRPDLDFDPIARTSDPEVLAYLRED